MKASFKNTKSSKKSLFSALFLSAVLFAAASAPSNAAAGEPLFVGKSYFSLATTDLRESFRKAIKKSESRSNIRKIANGAVAAPNTVNTLANLTPKSFPTAMSAR